MLVIPSTIVGAIIGYYLAGELGAFLGGVMGLLIGGALDAQEHRK